jgi:hypothetical protein
VVADEVRRVLGDDDAFAEAVIAELRHALGDRGIGLGGRDHLDQPQVARRVEEMRAEPVRAEVVAAAFRELRDRNPRGVRRDDRARTADGVDLFEQRALDVELFDDRFHDPVGVFQLREVGVEAAGGDARERVRGEERIGLERAGALQAVAGHVCVEVEQQHRHARVREMRRDLRPHRPRSEHRHRSHQVRHLLRPRAVDEEVDDRVGVGLE